MDKKQEAKRLRELGFSYAIVAGQLGVGSSTVERWCNPVAAERNRQYNRDYNQQRHNTDSTFRLAKCLRTSHSAARKRRHAPCHTPIEKLAELWNECDGYCECCGLHEDKIGKHLVIDHNHETGEFRGFICDNCNKGIGFLRDRPESAVTYLKRRSTCVHC